MQRLKTRSQFDAVLAGATVSRTQHFALHRVAAPLPESPDLRGPAIGAMVPKRWARRAVTRNLLKRQIYVFATAFETRLVPTAHVVRLRAGFDRTQFPSAASSALKLAARAELEQLFTRAVSPPAGRPLPPSVRSAEPRPETGGAAAP